MLINENEIKQTVDFEKKIREFLAEEIALIIVKQKEKGLIASGESAKLLSQRDEKINDGQIIRGELVDGSGSFEYQERGRGPNGSGTGTVLKGGLFGKIYTWLRFRKYGLDWSTKQTQVKVATDVTNKIGKVLKDVDVKVKREKTDKEKRVSLAWAITKKIQKKGTFTHIQGKNTGVLSEPLSSERLEDFKSKLMSTSSVVEIQKLIIKNLEF